MSDKKSEVPAPNKWFVISLVLLCIVCAAIIISRVAEGAWILLTDYGHITWPILVILIVIAAWTKSYHDRVTP